MINYNSNLDKNGSLLQFIQVTTYYNKVHWKMDMDEIFLPILIS